MTQPKRGLGRGLDALIPSGARNKPAAQPETPPVEDPPAPVAEAPAPPPATPAPAPPAPEPAPAPPRRSGPELLDIDLISPNPEQPRTHFEPEKLRELADSIRQHGIFQPLVVTRDEDGSYRLIAGERRLQAARLAGLQTVPIVSREADDAELLELALIENIQRADLNPIEEAMAYRRLVDEYGLTQEDAARRVGKSRAAVSNALRLLGLEQEIRRSLVEGEISEGHVPVALLGLQDARARVETWREVARRHLSVRDTEALVRRRIAGSQAAPGGAAPAPTLTRRDAMIADIEKRLQRALSTRVTVQPQKKGARIVIECYSSEEFDSVVQQLAGDDDEY